MKQPSDRGKGREYLRENLLHQEWIEQQLDHPKHRRIGNSRPRPPQDLGNERPSNPPCDYKKAKDETGGLAFKARL